LVKIYYYGFLLKMSSYLKNKKLQKLDDFENCWSESIFVSSLWEERFSSHVGFLCNFDFSQFLSLVHHMLVLNSHNTTSPGSSECEVVVIVGVEVVLEVIEIGEIFLSNVSKSDTGGGLGVDESSESCLSLDESVWNVVLSAECWQEDHDLSWVDIVCHDNELCLTFFNELGDVVETELEVDWLWGRVSFGTSLSGLGFSDESVSLLLGGFWRVLGEELQEVVGLVSVNGVLELSKSWWGLESQEHDSLLSLDSDVLWPFDESGEVSDWLDISTDSVVSGGFGEKG